MKTGSIAEYRFKVLMVPFDFVYHALKKTDSY